MHLELLIPDLIAPDASATQGLVFPALQLLLGRGLRQVGEPVSIEDWLCRAAGLEQGWQAPIAAISLLGDGGAPGQEAWLRADPVNLRAERDQLMLDTMAAATLDHEQAVELVATLNKHFLADGMRFAAANARKWYAQTATLPEVMLAPPSAVAAAGGNVDAVRPQGRDAMAWQRIGNEVQMLLHEHPVNQAREARGLAAINSVWFWGAGVLPAPVTLRFTGIYSNDAVARGFALLANCATAPSPATAPQWLAQMKPGSAIDDKARPLIVLDGLRTAVVEQGVEAWRTALAASERDWFAPLLQAMREERIGMLTIHAPSPRCSLSVEVIKNDLKKFWRRTRPLAAYATLEP